MKKILLLWFFYGIPWLCQAGDIKVYFSPNGACQQAVIAEIKKAVGTMDIAMYYLTSGKIARALVDARQRHVNLRIVLDQSQEIEPASKSGYLIKHGFEIKYHLGFGLMHNKFAVIDGKVLMTGSFNWTSTAEEKNEENLLIITDQQTIERYKDRFEYLWHTSRYDLRNARKADLLPAWFCTSFHILCR